MDKLLIDAKDHIRFIGLLIEEDPVYLRKEIHEIYWFLKCGCPIDIYEILAEEYLWTSYALLAQEQEVPGNADV